MNYILCKNHNLCWEQILSEIIVKAGIMLTAMPERIYLFMVLNTSYTQPGMADG
jgi:hypothetical protein